jgi:hypothetical protein
MNGTVSKINGSGNKKTALGAGPPRRGQDAARRKKKGFSSFPSGSSRTNGFNNISRGFDRPSIPLIPAQNLLDKEALLLNNRSGEQVFSKFMNLKNTCPRKIILNVLCKSTLESMGVRFKQISGWSNS